jgi:hypothetical protein
MWRSKAKESFITVLRGVVKLQFRAQQSNAMKKSRRNYLHGKRAAIDGF